MLLLVLLTLFLACIICLTIWFYSVNQKLLTEARKFSTGRLALPLLGHGHLIAKGLVRMTNIVLEMIQSSVAQGVNTIVLWVGPYPIFLFSDPQDIKVLLNSTKSLDLGFETIFMEFAYGTSMPIAPGFLWKNKRRHMKRLFHLRNLEYLMPTINHMSRDITVSLSQHVGKEWVDVLNYLFKYIIEAVHCLLFASTHKENIQEEHTFENAMRAIDKTSKLVQVRLLKLWLWPESLFNVLYKREINEINSIWKSFLKKPMQLADMHMKHRTTEITSDDIESTTYEGGIPERLSMLDICRVLEKVCPGYSEKDLFQDFTATYYGGAETAKVMMPSCFLALAAKPQIQERLHAEITSVVGSEDSDVTLQDINSMPYLEQVLKETLRKFINVPVLSRKTQDSLKLSSCILPAGAIAGVAIAGVHYNPKYYPNPNTFDPDRFTPENEAKRDPYCFIPFSGGPRNCIGKDYAMIVMKTVVVHVIRKYKLTTAADIENITYVDAPITKMAGGYKVGLELR